VNVNATRCSFGCVVVFFSPLHFCSEHGPFYISSNGTLTPNDSSWNKDANILYVEQPAGVGFSFADTDEDLVTDDATSAADNYELVLQFLDRFPERRSNPFYVASESYGGHYMPQLTLEILKKNTNNFINFKGFLVGNPYVDPFSNAITQFASYYSHGLLAKPLWDHFLENCNDPKSFLTKACDHITNEMFNQFGHGINPYALDYPVCVDDKYNFDDEIKRRPHTRHLKGKTSENTSPETPVMTTSSQLSHLMNLTRAGPPITSNEDVEYQPCAEQHLFDFLDTPAVRKALHVHPSITTPWKKCGGIFYSEYDVDTTTIHLYKELVTEAIAGNHDLNMMVFSGDDDSICSTAGTQEWIWGLGADPVSIWDPWSVQDQTAGFVTHFDLGPKTEAKFSFVTVHGAGHEVPAYKPVEALQMFRNYLSGNWLV
jgi:carboxypeptidase C (cathepsin A)